MLHVDFVRTRSEICSEHVSSCLHIKFGLCITAAGGLARFLCNSHLNELQVHSNSESVKSLPHHSGHGEALEEESFAAVTVSLKDHEVSVMADLSSQRPEE